MNLKEFAVLLGVEAKGDGAYPIKGVRDLERLSADQPLDEGFVYFFENPAVLKRHPNPADKAVILTTPALADKFKQALVAPQAEVRIALIKLLQHFDKTSTYKPGVSPDAKVHPSAKVAASAVVHAGAVLMEGAVVGERAILYPGVVLEPFAEVGEGTVLFPNVVIGHHCVIGKDCIIHGCTVIGADGFGFYDQPGKRYKVPQIGNVIIADHVEIGASCTVDRATIESTRIGEHTKFDNQVHVGHNTQVGRFVYIVGNSAIGGSVTLEDGAMISGMVIVKDHLHVGAGAIVMGMSGVAQDCEAKTAYFGTPARPAKQRHRMDAALEKLPELLVRFRELEEKVGKVPTGA
jgi:UDP-3-O-[3-hydroxymyristoyl] glucosamine N-acyltransferase